MTPKIKAVLLATAMAAVALVPAAGLVTLATADAAHAKGEGNGNGGGGERGNGGGERGNGGSGERGNGGSASRGGDGDARGGGRPEWAGSQRSAGENGNRGGRSETARDGGSDPISNFLRGLTGEEKREARAQARAEARAARLAPTEYAPVESIAPGKRPARNSDMHPSQLGNMNGALNANMNAVLAHIRNGNTSGPVGGLAALAVADAELADATGVLERELVASLLQAGGYTSIAEYNAAVSADPTKEVAALEIALDALGEDANVDDPIALWRPDAGAVADATAALPELTEAQRAAEENMLSLWNKNGDVDPAVVTPEEQALIDDLRARIAAHETEIREVVSDREAGIVSDEEAYCEGIAACEAPEDGETLAAAD
jgi:hypothetical protein